MALSPKPAESITGKREAGVAPQEPHARQPLSHSSARRVPMLTARAKLAPFFSRFSGNLRSTIASTCATKSHLVPLHPPREISVKKRFSQATARFPPAQPTPAKVITDRTEDIGPSPA
ncbi:hypothetical protein BOTBODRAFT_58624 [Botryobasidium botryosum FD-172 SS1]|uniref:Uncharacterized protein n=1 Tax=Botryobasidium botryosum (strain FD-172 SS1) TaxID=930990 RepID=A0A067M1X0_BOTB1|nr:hypothetical protein BOTBODRAFT_58624 [Botryobasidium botryosum FD-172 SS1]